MDVALARQCGHASTSYCQAAGAAQLSCREDAKSAAGMVPREPACLPLRCKCGLSALPLHSHCYTVCFGADSKCVSHFGKTRRQAGGAVCDRTHEPARWVKQVLLTGGAPEVSTVFKAKYRLSALGNSEQAQGVTRE